MPNPLENPPDVEFFWRFLDYDPETGLFRRKRREDRREGWNTRFAGTVAGYTAADGYRRVSLEGRMFLEHRLAIYMTQGLWPTNVDHINGVKHDNRIANLRPVTRTQNLWNQKNERKSFSGLKGVSLSRTGRWRARLVQNGKEVNLGEFETAREAKAAYDDAAARLRGAYCRR